MSDTHNLLKIAGRENAAGQSVECLYGINFEMALDTSRIAKIPGLKSSYQAEIRCLGYKDDAAFQAGLAHDPTAGETINLNIAENADLKAKFDEVFAMLLPLIATEKNAEIVQVDFED